MHSELRHLDFPQQFLSALVKASKKFKCKEVNRYIELAVYLLQHQV